ncbi:helix-turn-helix domain-containing protein [Paenibacillus flagellatus]|uniref:XRE family transcriptional regulator n=1 Tax=Paenibacillus flagellatus TaxID=2211139 RepID=A0A2V5KBW3_9BACL|nr:helix-turn-helix transcriptional regulator [Paenibacillus flagellatus]PYI57055.1 XRE family transcriptional regulator [Paenibacillus flagellatus]
MNFGKTVRHALIDRGMNPSDLAREAGYSPMYVHNLLNGNRRWNIETMERICNALDLEIRVVPKKKSG